MAVARAKITLITSSKIQRDDLSVSHGKAKIDPARLASPRRINAERIRNPRATQDVLGLRHAVKNFSFLPRSRMRNGAPRATKMGPQRRAEFERSKGMLQNRIVFEGLK
jgi:hypothetical protein